MGMELEWKYAATQEDLRRIRAFFGGFGAVAMTTTYYDTPQGELSARRITLRSRRENRRTVCTVKTPNPDGSRGEWEVTGLPIEEAIPELCKLGCPGDLADLTAQGIVPVCGARFDRLYRLERGPDFAVEIALDFGHLLAGDRKAPLCEVEIELKSGSQAVCVAFARKLAELYQLIPEEKSKFRRALDLYRGE